VIRFIGAPIAAKTGAPLSKNQIFTYNGALPALALASKPSQREVKSL